MGKVTPGDHDMADKAVGGVINAVETGPWNRMGGTFTAWFSGAFIGQLIVEMSYDGGTSAVPLTGADGAPLVIDEPGRIAIDEVEEGVLYRVRAIAWTSGDANWRFSK